MKKRSLLIPAVLAGAACTAEAPLSIDALSDEERETLFLGAIRNSGFVCAEIMHLQQVEDSGAWRVSCTDPIAYLATVEPDGDIAVSLTPYVEGPARGQPRTVIPVPPRN